MKVFFLKYKQRLLIDITLPSHSIVPLKGLKSFLNGKYGGGINCQNVATQSINNATRYSITETTLKKTRCISEQSTWTTNGTSMCCND